MYFSLGPVALDAMKGQPAEEQRKAFEVQLGNQCLPLLFELEKPGIFEIFAGWDPADPDYPGNRDYQARAFDAILGAFAELESPLIGIAYHEFALSRHFRSMWTPDGWPVESVLRDYFTSVIPDQKSIPLSAELLPPDVKGRIHGFESVSVPRELWVANAGGSSSMMIDAGSSIKGVKSLHIRTENTNTPGSFAWCMLAHNYPSPQDWERYETLNFWMRNDGNATSLLVSVYDLDGDRYSAELTILNRDQEKWALYSVALGSLVHLDWAESGDGKLDLRGSGSSLAIQH